MGCPRCRAVCCWHIACLVACTSAGLDLDVLLLESLEQVELRLAMLLFVGQADLRMCTNEELVALRDGVGLNLPAKAPVSAHGTDSIPGQQAYGKHIWLPAGLNASVHTEQTHMATD